MATKVDPTAAIAEPVSEELVAFFADRDGVVQVFDFDNDSIFDFNWQLYKNCFACHACAPPLACIPPILVAVWCCCMPMILGGCAKQNVRDGADAQHVCITQDGIVYTVDTRKTACRCKCTEKGKISKTVPWDKITNCDVEEPAGATGPICCLVNRTLNIVVIDTASGSRGENPLGRAEEDWGGIACEGKITSLGPGGHGGQHELVLTGLKEPKAFKDLVWLMKRGDGPGRTTQSTVVSAQPGVQRDAGGTGEDLVGLLAEHNALAKQQLAKQDEMLVELRKIAANTCK